MTTTLERVPPHLRHFVATQDYGAYDEIDHAVWRFILIQTQARLRQTAHPAYAPGLERTGIGLERIPRIEEMDARLSEFGWGAVCVDGFIPPRAFQEFQALGIMTIAGEIRSCEHLSYTPAPDIVHESAGHAPIIPDETYRAYLQRFGEIGARAFSQPDDAKRHAAIHELSELKEDPHADPQEIEAAEARIAGTPTALSEAALLSRLHWWTVEYGLVGRAVDYRIYGAGLLSSLAESPFCHEPRVEKRRLDASCIDVGYDITRPQPHLYVAEDFEHLLDTLDEVAGRLAQRRGDAYALEAARASAEVSTLHLDSDLQVSGWITNAEKAAAGAHIALLDAGFALAQGGRHLDGTGPGDLPGRAACVLAPWSDPLPDAGPLDLEFGDDLRLEGRVEGHGGAGAARWLVVRDAVVSRASVCVCRHGWLTLVFGGPLRGASAGPADPAWWPDSELGDVRVPRRRTPGDEHRALLDLYHEALELWREPDAPGLVDGFASIADALGQRFPEDWLLRWNLLECLRKVDHGVVLASRLRDELLEIEARYPRDAPITMGLRYLGLAPAPRA